MSNLDAPSILGIFQQLIGAGNLDEAKALALVLAQKDPLELADFGAMEQDARTIGIVYQALATNGSAPGAVTGRLAAKVDTQARKDALREYCFALRFNPAAQTEFKSILQGLAAIEPPFFRRQCLSACIGTFDKSHIESAWQNALATVPPEDLADIVPAVLDKLKSVPGKVASVLEGLDQRMEHSPSEALIAVHRAAVTSWLQSDTNRALTYLNSVKPSPAKNLLILRAVSELCRHGENAAAVEWINQITDRELQERAALDLPKSK